ncbi:hypothetical protein HY837_00150 [archaeon]|nr:hypothetical protein [archaeon]
MMADFKKIEEMKPGERGFIHLSEAFSFSEDGCLLIERTKLVFPNQSIGFQEPMIVRKGPDKDDYAVIFPEHINRHSCPLKKDYDPNNYAKIRRVSTRR